MSRTARITQAEIARALRAFERVHGAPATVAWGPDGMMLIKAGQKAVPVFDRDNELDRELAEWESKHRGKG